MGKERRAMSGFNTNELLKYAGNYPTALMPAGFVADNPFVDEAADLLAQSSMIADAHEAVAVDGATPPEKADYMALAEKHQQLADAYEALAVALRNADSTKYIQAISACGDAMGAHLKASKIAQMMCDSLFLGEYNMMYPNMASNSFRYGHTAQWDTENKQWNASYLAFQLARQAYNYVAFATGNSMS